MKKIFLGVVALTLTFVLTACGTSANSAAITSLGNQLDETANAISNIQTVNPSDLNITKTMLESMTADNTNERLYNNAYSTQQNLLNEEYYKTDILRKTANIKNCLSKNIKLSKAQISAVKDLTSSLAKYTNSISYSESEMNSAVKSISSMKKNITKNAEKINAKLNRLACNSNSRSSYYENLINTLDQLENCLNVSCTEDSEQQTQTETSQTNQTESGTTDSAQTKTKTGITKNIDTYSTNDNTNYKNQTRQNPYNYAYNGNRGYYPANYYNNQYLPENYYNYSAPYGNVYNRFNRFNPSRNTDTYGPMMRNIDTYGYNNANNNFYGYGINGVYRNGINYGNGYTYGINGNYANKLYNSNNFNRLSTPYATTYANTDSKQEPRLEDYEEVKDDNTVEKINKNNNVENLKTGTNSKETTTANDSINENLTSDEQTQEVSSTDVKILRPHKEKSTKEIVDSKTINDEDEELNRVVKAH